MTAPLLERWTRPGHVFLFFFLAYLATWGGHYTSGDGAIKRAWATALLERQSSDLDAGPGTTYSKYGIGHTLVALVPLAASRLSEAAGGPRVEAALYTLLFVVNGAAFLALVASYLSTRYPPVDVAATLLLLGFATTWWVHTRLDFTEPLVATALLAGFLLVRRKRLVLGIVVASIAGLLKVECFVLVGVLLAWAAWAGDARQVLGVGLPALLPAAGVHVWSVWLREWQTSYGGEQFSTPFLVGLHGLLFSGGKSVVLFSPPLLLAIVALRRFARDREGVRDATFFAAIFVVQLAFYATWWDWSGDDAWGPRFMVPGVMLLCITTVAAAHWRRTVVLVCGAGVAVQLLGVLVSPLDYVLLVRRQDMRRASLFHGDDRRLDFEDVRFHLRYSQLAGHWVLVRYALGVPPSPGASDDERSGTPLHRTLAPEHWRAAARIDLLWLNLIGEGPGGIRERAER